MARQYVVTEEEMLSLIDQLKLEALRDNNVCHVDPNMKPADLRDSIHRGFHFVVVRWVQAMGFSGIRS